VLLRPSTNPEVHGVLAETPTSRTSVRWRPESAFQVIDLPLSRSVDRSCGSRRSACLLLELFLEIVDIPVETGVFQASMAVHLVNDDPVTLLCDS